MLRSVPRSLRLLGRLKQAGTFRNVQDEGSKSCLQCSAPLSTTSGSFAEPKTQIREAKEAPGKVKETSEGDIKEYKTSFAKDIFLGNFDHDLLNFPEVLEKEQHETLHEMLEPIERFFNEKVDSKKIDVEAKIPDEVLQGLKDLGLFGQQVPQEYGGLGLNATEYARLQEIISLDGSIAVTLAAHQTIGYKGLLLYGNEEQKKRYLSKLASGEMLAAFALTEPSSGSDAGSIRTSAEMSQDGSHWILNGNKIWISNGGKADFFTVFARTADDSVDVKASRRISAFLVERKFGGVTSGKPEDKLGIRGSNTTEVHFDNVKVPAENVLGEIGDGFKIAMNILNSGRFSMGSAGAGFLKKLLAFVAEHAIQRKQFGRPLAEFGLIKEKVATLAMNIYVMEAMAYTTSGLIDSGLYEDCAQEAAMVKIFSSEAGFNGINEALQILGGMGYMKDYPVERALRDSRIMSIFEGTNEILRLLVALNGIKHAGDGLKELVKQLRNPFKYPNVLWKSMIQRHFQRNDKPKFYLNLQRYLHPSLEMYADQCLEYSVLRLQYVVEILLQRHGKNIIEQQLELKRLADIAIDIYAMTCALSRASRAYCIGLANAQTEIQIAQLFSMLARNRIRNNVNSILGETELTGDDLLLGVADEMFKHKGYCIEHPLTRNFW